MGLRWILYCHTHTATGRRYVGLTKKTLLQRWNQHVYTASKTKAGRGFSHFANAIRAYGKDAFTHEALEVCTDLEVANLAEECWIELYDTRNPEKGFNLTRGGSHAPHSSKNPWDRAEYREKSLAATRRKWTPELRARVSSIHRGVKLSPEHCDAIAKARLGKSPSPEAIAKSLEKKKVTLALPEVKAKMSAAAKARWQDPSYRAVICDSSSAAAKARWQDPSYRARATKHDGIHKFCSVHGPVLLKDCYRKVHANRFRTISYECKECVNIRRRAAWKALHTSSL